MSPSPKSVRIIEEGRRERFGIECSRWAAPTVGRPLPGSVKLGGSVGKLRAAFRAQ